MVIVGVQMKVDEAAGFLLVLNILSISFRTGVYFDVNYGQKVSRGTLVFPGFLPPTSPV